MLSTSSSSSPVVEKKSLNPELIEEIKNLGKRKKQYSEPDIKINTLGSITTDGRAYSYPIYPTTHLIELPHHLLITENKIAEDKQVEFSGISIWHKGSRERLKWLKPPMDAKITAMKRVNNFLIVGYSGI